MSGASCAVLTSLSPATTRVWTWSRRLWTRSFSAMWRGRLGNGPRDLQEVKLLNLVVRRAPVVLRYEADPRRAEQLLRDLSGPEFSGARPI
eukprot:8669162-Alexandrium_andersonii.AAC.1